MFIEQVIGVGRVQTEEYAAAVVESCTQSNVENAADDLSRPRVRAFKVCVHGG